MIIMKNSKAFALVETLIVSTIIATILMYVFIQFNKVESKYDESFRYNDVDNLASEAREKLIEIRPLSIGQASRISGVNPADISILMVYLRRKYNDR